MKLLFYIISLLIIISTLKTITHNKPIYSIIYLLISLQFISFIFFILGSNLAGVLEIIIYSGAILVLFLFCLMIINSKIDNNIFYFRKNIIFISILFFILYILIFNFINIKYNKIIFSEIINSKNIGIKFFNFYPLIIELSSILLFCSLIISCQICKQKNKRLKK